MSRAKAKPVEEDAEVETRLIGHLRPEDADLTAASVKWFLKLAEIETLVVRVTVTLIEVPDEFYAASNKDRRGDIKKPGGIYECINITATNLLDFAVTGTWYSGEFKGALVGGKKSGHWPEKFYKQITKAKEEIARCMS